jgi:hypothetical protein
LRAAQIDDIAREGPKNGGEDNHSQRIIDVYRERRILLQAQKDDENHKGQNIGQAWPARLE